MDSVKQRPAPANRIFLHSLLKRHADNVGIKQEKQNETREESFGVESRKAAQPSLGSTATPPLPVTPILLHVCAGNNAL